MIDFQPRPPREQAPLATQPYDRWIIGDDYVKAEFHRRADGYLLRFPGEADFAIHDDGARVIGWPAPEATPEHFQSLYCNAVLPLIGDHNGGLFLHGSAVAVAGRGVAFIGLSGGGKTTLAGAFAKAGHPFLTEDVIELVPDGAGYQLQPKPSGLRLFADSAAYLLDAEPDMQGSDKFDVADAMALPFRDLAAPLAAIFLLGADHDAPLAVTPLAAPVAAHQLLPHSFILDVEDKARLGRHFGRIVELPERVPCYRLDYLRQYAELPHVLAAVIAQVDMANGSDKDGQ
jgi:hypothetical protein